MANEQDFLNLVKNLQVNEANRLQEEARVSLPDKRYVIVFTARSGSSWLTSVLSSTKLLGFPEEYINPDFIPSVATAVNAVTQQTFLAALQRRRKTPNGAFGIEVREIDVMLFGAQIFFEIFGAETKFFYLWRDNIVAQAISLHRAVATGYFHSSDAEHKAAPLKYDGLDILRWLEHLALQENANLDMLVQRRRPFINLCYEQLIGDRAETLQLFARHLGVDLPPECLSGGADKSLTKIGDEWNDETERRFRSDFAHEVAKVEAGRRIKPYILSRASGFWLRPDKLPAPPQS